MCKYCYKGKVLEFNKVISENWQGETIAPTEKKARSNLAYQFKQSTGRTVCSSAIKLPGELIVVD